MHAGNIFSAIISTSFLDGVSIYKDHQESLTYDRDLSPKSWMARLPDMVLLITAGYMA
jgi:hypothetical protein